jgi:hypothetical protein
MRSILVHVFDSDRASELRQQPWAVPNLDTIVCSITISQQWRELVNDWAGTDEALRILLTELPDGWVLHTIQRDTLASYHVLVARLMADDAADLGQVVGSGLTIASALSDATIRLRQLVADRSG